MVNPSKAGNDVKQNEQLTLLLLRFRRSEVLEALLRHLVFFSG